MEYSTLIKHGQHLYNFNKIESNDSSNIDTIKRQEYNGHGEIEQGIESHLLGCNTQRHQTSFLGLFPHLNNKIHVMFHTSSSLSISRLSKLRSSLTNFINNLYNDVFYYDYLSSSSFKTIYLTSLTIYYMFLMKSHHLSNIVFLNSSKSSLFHTYNMSQSF